jgi:hypothetical protein
MTRKGGAHPFLRGPCFGETDAPSCTYRLHDMIAIAIARPHSPRTLLARFSHASRTLLARSSHAPRSHMPTGPSVIAKAMCFLGWVS